MQNEYTHGYIHSTKPVHFTKTLTMPYLLGNKAELFSWQVVKAKDKPPVKVSVSIQRPVVDVSLLFVLLHARHPAATENDRTFTLMNVL